MWIMKNTPPNGFGMIGYPFNNLKMSVLVPISKIHRLINRTKSKREAFLKGASKISW